MLPRPMFTEEHEMFREQVRRFAEKEIVPHHDQWEKDGMVTGHVATFAIACFARGVGKGVPMGWGTAVFIPGPFNLVG